MSTSSLTKQKDGESRRLEKLTIAIYHREEDAKKLLDSIMRQRSQEKKKLVTKVLEGKSSTEPLVSEGPDSLTCQSMQTLCHGDWVNDSRSINSLSAKSVLAGEKLVATYSIST